MSCMNCYKQADQTPPQEPCGGVFLFPQGLLFMTIEASQSVDSIVAIGHLRCEMLDRKPYYSYNTVKGTVLYDRHGLDGAYDII